MKIERCDGVFDRCQNAQPRQWLLKTAKPVRLLANRAKEKRLASRPASVKLGRNVTTDEARVSSVHANRGQSVPLANHLIPRKRCPKATDSKAASGSRAWRLCLRPPRPLPCPIPHTASAGLSKLAVKRVLLHLRPSFASTGTIQSDQGQRGRAQDEITPSFYHLLYAIRPCL
jgi:hypothetical protein